jgi:hypothetical protein
MEGRIPPHRASLNDRRHRIGGFGLSLVVRAAQVLLATTMSVGAGAGSHEPREPEKRARR